MIGLKRKAFMSLRQLVCIKAFGTGPTNNFWPGMGYQGPRSTPEVMQGQHHDPPEQREFDFTPYLLNGKQDTNEVVANRALEIMGYKKGQYEHLHPNDHVNKNQSTNDSYPTSCKLAILIKHFPLVREMEALVSELCRKAADFKSNLKMGRTQLQDAIGTTLMVWEGRPCGRSRAVVPDPGPRCN